MLWLMREDAVAGVLDGANCWRRDILAIQTVYDLWWCDTLRIMKICVWFSMWIKSLSKVVDVLKNKEEKKDLMERVSCWLMDKFLTTKNSTWSTKRWLIATWKSLR